MASISKLEKKMASISISQPKPTSDEDAGSSLSYAEELAIRKKQLRLQMREAWKRTEKELIEKERRKLSDEELQRLCEQYGKSVEEAEEVLTLMTYEYGPEWPPMKQHRLDRERERARARGEDQGMCLDSL